MADNQIISMGSDSSEMGSHGALPWGLKCIFNGESKIVHNFIPPIDHSILAMSILPCCLWQQIVLNPVFVTVVVTSTHNVHSDYDCAPFRESGNCKGSEIVSGGTVTA